MRKHPVKLQTLKGIPPGVYMVDLSEGVAPGTTIEVEAVEAEWLLRAVEKTGEKKGAGVDMAGAAEKLAPALASLVMRIVG